MDRNVVRNVLNLEAERITALTEITPGRQRSARGILKQKNSLTLSHTLRQVAAARAHLFLQALDLGGHTLVAFVLVAGAQPADEHLTLATEELLQVLVLGADLLGQVARGCDELVLLQGLLGLVGLQVGFTV